MTTTSPASNNNAANSTTETFPGLLEAEGAVTTMPGAGRPAEESRGCSCLRPRPSRRVCRGSRGDHRRCNSVSPGTIWTPQLDRLASGDRAAWEPIFAQHHMLGRVGEPGEAASVILFLCSAGASFITGADLLVDGGYLGMGHDRLHTPLPYPKE